MLFLILFQCTESTTYRINPTYVQHMILQLVVLSCRLSQSGHASPFPLFFYCCSLDNWKTKCNTSPLGEGFSLLWYMLAFNSAANMAPIIRSTTNIIRPIDDQGGILLVIYWTECSIGIIVVSLRFYSRIKVRGVGLDDWIMLLILVKENSPMPFKIQGISDDVYQF